MNFQNLPSTWKSRIYQLNYSVDEIADILDIDNNILSRVLDNKQEPTLFIVNKMERFLRKQGRVFSMENNKFKKR